MKCQVAILAGGMGTRLKSRTGNLPKPMALVMGRPVLEHLISLCRLHGFERIALLVHYEHAVIADHFGDGSRLGVQLVYRVEREARGTAGALLDALPALAPRFLVIYGDTYADVDLLAIWRVHACASASATLLLHPNDHPFDSDLIEVDAGGRVIGVHPYPHADAAAHRNLVNAALYVMEADAVAAVAPREGKADLARHSFPAMLARGMTLHAHLTPEYIKDMGTPERLDKVEADLNAGLPDRLSSRGLRNAVFIDRDGTLNVEVDHLRSPEQLHLLDGAGEAVRRLNRAGVLAVGITNQPVLARGDVTLAGLERIHSKLDALLGEAGGYLDRLYVCPHHPHGGFAGEVSELKVRCDCRKPATGLFERAARELGIDRRSSWMVGDSSADILAGARAGVRTVLVRTGYAGQDRKHVVEPDYVVPDLVAAVEWILHGHRAMASRLVRVAADAAQARLILVAGPARAGKSMATRVLCELLTLAGRDCHLINLDGWLKPVEERPETEPVDARYDLDAAASALAPLIAADSRHWLATRRYERRTRSAMTGPILSIGPCDVVIVEGVPALMHPSLRELASVRLFLDVGDLERHRRLAADYGWRGVTAATLAEVLQRREAAEVPAVRASAAFATHRVDCDLTP